ncbi:MAG: ribbon-helix-helix domain-containing protein [Myxococcaceae bacterium]
MQELETLSHAPQPIHDPQLEIQEEPVSTHVLVGEEQVAKLRELSRRTRVAQSEYLREAVDDLLQKYTSAEEKR